MLQQLPWRCLEAPSSGYRPKPFERHCNRPAFRLGGGASLLQPKVFPLIWGVRKSTTIPGDVSASSDPAEPVIALIFPISARIIITDKNLHDMLGIFEAQLGRYSNP